MTAMPKCLLVLIVVFCAGCQTLPAAVIPTTASSTVEITAAPAQIACGAKDFIHQYTITIGSHGTDYFALNSCNPGECSGQAKISKITFQKVPESASEGFWLSLNHQFELIADIELSIDGKVRSSKVTHQFRSSAVIDYTCRNLAYQMPALKQKIYKELNFVVSQYETM